MALLLALVAPACESAAPDREIVIAARGMTFVLEDAPQQSNPVIILHAGERVRLVLKNEAPGLLHDFAIPDLGVATAEIRAGETAEVIFTVPETRGRFEYRCRPHAELMHGVVEILSDSPPSAARGTRSRSSMTRVARPTRSRSWTHFVRPTRSRSLDSLRS